MKSWMYPLVIVLAVVAVAACDRGSDDRDSDSDPTAVEPKTEALDAVWTEESLGEARGAAAVRRDAEDGAGVVVTGRVRGFVPGHAAFQLIDKSLRSCAERPDDNCPTPWDYCCETPEDRRDATVLVEVREEGRPLRVELKGYRGLDHLDEVVVEGRVVRDDAGNVTIVATAIRKL